MSVTIVSEARSSIVSVTPGADRQSSLLQSSVGSQVLPQHSDDPGRALTYARQRAKPHLLGQRERMVTAGALEILTLNQILQEKALSILI